MGLLPASEKVVRLSQKTWLLVLADDTDELGGGTVITTRSLPFTQGPLTVQRNV
jgi:hypothetical protein